MNVLLTTIFCGINPAVLSFFFDSDNDAFGYIFFLLIAGPLFFSLMYKRYRNIDKRHYHEKETPVTMSNLRGFDTFVEHKKRQNSKVIPGANNQRVEGSIVEIKDKGAMAWAEKMVTPKKWS